MVTRSIIDSDFESILRRVDLLVSGRGRLISDPASRCLCAVPITGGTVVAVEILLDRARVNAGLGAAFYVPRDSEGFVCLVVEVIEAIMRGDFVQYVSKDGSSRASRCYVRYASGSLGDEQPEADEIAVRAPAWE